MDAKPTKDNDAAFQRLNELNRICRNAVAKAQEESRRMGVPNVYSYDGVIYYELPNGELTTEVPEIYRTKPEPSSR